MKKIEDTHRTQPRTPLKLQRETLRRLQAADLARVHAGQDEGKPTYPTFTKEPI